MKIPGKTITRKTNWRVAVTPRRLGDYGHITWPDPKDQARREKEYFQRCEEIRDAILRHVDNVSSVSIEFDIETELILDKCSYCDSLYEEDDAGMPVCCEEAQLEWVALAGSDEVNN